MYTGRTVFSQIMDFFPLIRRVCAGLSMQYRRRYSRLVDKSTGLRCDQTILLTGQDSSRAHRRPVVQEPLERGVVLQMDQTALAPTP
jgi:hypothetical protein